MEFTQTQKNMAKVAAVALAILVMSTSTVGVGLGDMARAFPDVPTTRIQLVIGLPSLIGIPMTILGIPIAQRVSCKLILIVIQIVFVITGCSVFFLRDFNLILLMRAIMGIAKGMYNPILIATISFIFQGDERTQVLGWRNAATMAGGILFSFIGGYLAVIGWNYLYLIYAIGIPCAIIAMICLPNIKLPKAEKRSGEEKIPFSQKVNAPVVITAFKAFLLIITTRVSAANISMHILENEIGDSSGTGIANALMMAAGVVAGVILGKLFLKTRRFTVTIGIICLAAGLFITAIAPNIPVIIAGQILLGYGLGTYDPALQTLLSRCANPAYLIAATGLYSFGQNFGQFISPYLTTPLGDTTTRFYVATGIALAVLVFDLFTTGRYKWFGTDYPADRPLPEGAVSENAKA